MLRRLLVIVVVVSGILPVLSGTSWACSCAPHPEQPYRTAAHDGNVIYVGRVVAERPGMNPEYDVEVTRPLKGATSREQIRTVHGYATCAQDLDKGRVLVVDDEASTCGYTTQSRVSHRADVVYDELQKMAGYRASTHVVRRNEWLYKIARDRLQFSAGTVATPACSQRPDCDAAAVRRAARKIYEANRARIGPDPDRVQPGLRLRIPRLR